MDKFLIHATLVALGFALFIIAAIGACYTRGYFAVGGELMLIALPEIVLCGVKTAYEIYDYKPAYKNCFLSCIEEINNWCLYNNIDIDAAIALKHEYNKTRPYRHNGKKI